MANAMDFCEMLRPSEAPNRKYLHMNFVWPTATKMGLNQTVIMEADPNGETFHIKEGRMKIRIGKDAIKTRRRDIPMEEWDEIYERYISHKYIVYSEKPLEVKKVQGQESLSVDGRTFARIEDPDAQNLVTKLLSAAQHAFEEAFDTKKIEEIPPKMVEVSKLILTALAGQAANMSVAEFNTLLNTLYAVLPRRQDRIKNATRESDFGEIIEHEQDLFDMVTAQLKDEELKQAASGKDILESYGLEVRGVTPEEEKYIKEKLHDQAKYYMQAWKVNNKKTERAFNDFVESELKGIKKPVHHLFHGSRSENFWSIITTGLNIRPTGVVITGKMFGNGTYFAPDACKSMGYTSTIGSRWANGTEATGYLAIYKVAVGNPAEPSGVRNYSYESLKKDGKHSVWCKRGGQIGLRMDEVVVYQNCQSTIEYLIEMK